MTSPAKAAELRAAKVKAIWWRFAPKRWKMRQLDAEGHEDGEGWIDQEPRGFHWAVSSWVDDGKGHVTETGDEGVETTYPQARDRILAFYRIKPSQVRFESGSNQKVLAAIDVEPKVPKPRLTAIKKTSNAARARAAKKSAKTTWAKIRAFVMPAKKKARSRR